MGVYSFPILIAVLILFLIAVHTAIPWLIYTYRKYGYFSFWSTFIILTFIFYALSAYFLVILPLPDVRDTCAMQSADTKYFQLIPFYFVYEIFSSGNINWLQPASYINIVRHSAFLPSLFNVFILLPLGVYVKYFFSKTMTLKRMVLIGFSVSLFFEITQITGLYGIYNCPYRLFDVDDLILNTLGAVIGFKIAPLILALFPSKDQPLEKAEKVFRAGTVSAMPKLLAIVIDYYVVAFVWLIFSLIFQIDHGPIEFFSKLLGLFILQFVMPLLTGGKTIGTIVLRFTLVQEEAGYSFRRALLKRWIGLITPWILGNTFLVVTRYAQLDMESDFYVFKVWMQVIVLGLWILIVAVLCIHIIYVLFRPRTRQFYFDKATGIGARFNKDTKYP